MNFPIKFCVFTDLHYDVIPDGDRRIYELIQDCKQKNVDFIVELGDLCNPTEENHKILRCFEDAKIPCYFSIGNHNTDFYSPETVLNFFGLKTRLLFYNSRKCKVCFFRRKLYKNKIRIFACVNIELQKNNRPKSLYSS